jgi:hypothetical protein
LPSGLAPFELGIERRPFIAAVVLVYAFAAFLPLSCPSLRGLPWPSFARFELAVRPARMSRLTDFGDPGAALRFLWIRMRPDENAANKSTPAGAFFCFAGSAGRVPFPIAAVRRAEASIPHQFYGK